MRDFIFYLFRIDVYVRRLGGAYGIKISRTTQVAIACSLVTQKLNRPCRFIMPMTTNTKAVGKRFGCANKYTVGLIILLRYKIAIILHERRD